jgi:hypothetical protein
MAAKGTLPPKLKLLRKELASAQASGAEAAAAGPRAGSA